MRTRMHDFAVSVSVLAMISVGAAGAQIVPCVSSMAGGMVYGIGETQRNIPFSGTTKSSFEQKLADGNAIHTVRQTRQARDSAGRTMTEIEVGCALGADGQMHDRKNVSVYDPVARTNMNWQVGNDIQPKVVHVLHQPDLRSASQPMTRAEPSAEELARQQAMAAVAKAQQAKTRNETRTEDLGVRDFNGVSAHGRRTTRTIPAGEEGNDQPLVVIDETWRSNEMGLTMMAIRDDPRTGRTVTEYEELNMGEPDPAVFQPPAGYKVQEQPQNGMTGMVGVAF
jgi:hypothetical protein